MDWISFFKVFHIIGWVSWFAGFFYIGRMFVYHRESSDRPEAERAVLLPQYNIMTERAYKIILNPAMMITWVGGIAMLIIYTLDFGAEWIRVNGWMHTKLLLLFALIGYHIWVKKMIAKLKNGQRPYSSFKFRLLNELPTMFLVSIVSLAIYKNALSPLYLIILLIVLAAFMYFAAKGYQKKREKMKR